MFNHFQTLLKRTCFHSSAKSILQKDAHFKHFFLYQPHLFTFLEQKQTKETNEKKNEKGSTDLYNKGNSEFASFKHF